jgi:hypothetical protein
MKLPKQHGRPGPYSFEQHQGIMLLNKSIDLRDVFENHSDALQTALQHLNEVNSICSEHGNFVAEFGGVRNPAILSMFQYKADVMRGKLMFLLSLVLPRNHQALSFYKQVRDRHYIMSDEHPWDEQLMTRWRARIREMEIELEAQLEATVVFTKDEQRRISLHKQQLSVILKDDILQWSL